MKLSKISRCIVVAIFVALLVFLGVLDIKLIFQNVNENSIYSQIIKILYGVVLFTFTLIYIGIKDKLYKRKIRRDISFFYRYLYLIAVIIGLRIFILINTLDLNNTEMLLNVVLTLIISLIIKRIIFNISKSDMLSVIGTVGYTMTIPMVNIDKTSLFLSTILIGVVVLSILFLQFLIDELKQKGIKTKKYVLYSILIGCCIGISNLLGIHYLVWIVVATGLLFISVNLDMTHLNFPKIIINILPQGQKENIYKLERLNINKILVSILISLMFMAIVYQIGKFIVFNLADNEVSNIIINNISCQLVDNYKVNNVLINSAKSLLSLSKCYYIVLITYILLLEILSFFLRRRYDTKTTMIKSLFIMLFFTTIIFGKNLVYFQPLFNVLFIIITIINTSSIYLNREERIKMLVA